MRCPKGFTIVELLIVIVIIAILAVITLVAFNGVQSRARASSLTTSLNQAKKKLDLYKVDNGTYPLTGNLTAAGLTNSTNTFYQYVSDGTTYCITASNAGTSYNATGTTSPASGACSGQVDGGMITNLAQNPGAESNVGWNANNSSVVPMSFTSAVKRSGNQSVESHSTAANTSLLSLYGTGAITGNGIPVTEGKTYTSSVYGMANVPYRIRTSYSYRVSGVWQGAVYTSYTNGIVGDWTRVIQTSSAPVGSDMVRVALFIEALSSQPANTSAWADDLMLVEGSSAYGYADGSSASWSWNGTPNNSSSTGPAL
jgi:prepilin-type N-terminal cleavage/methylation domain-containing protein